MNIEIVALESAEECDVQTAHTPSIWELLLVIKQQIHFNTLTISYQRLKNGKCIIYKKSKAFNAKHTATGLTLLLKSKHT